MNKQELKEILKKHERWLNNYNDGCKADLRCADLRGADLRWADLTGADLRSANLSGAYLSYAKLKNISYNEYTAFLSLVCPEKGSFTAFKKLRNDLIAELKIPAKAKRSSATSRKCRASEAKVVRIYNPVTKESFQKGVSLCDDNFVYEVGQTVKPTEPFDEDRWNECGSGIHFFITEIEAINYDS